MDIKEIYIEDKDYPKLLKNINNYPKKIYVMGNEKILNTKCVTVVGSRNMTEYGEKMTKEIVKKLTLAGITIVSGMAIGIDSIAHKTCIENGGRTIAVLGSGLNKIFPKQNEDLFKKILESNGCVISEYEPNTIAQKRFFPERNRIVSGLSLGTLVIEATYRSGTSITANYALEQKRELFCLPNCIGNKNSSGIINMLKKGANLITNADEILYKLGLITKKLDYEKLEEEGKCKKNKILEEMELQNLDDNAKMIYYYIKENVTVNSEEISNELKINIQKINMYLSILELKGLIVNSSGLNFKVREEICN